MEQLPAKQDRHFDAKKQNTIRIFREKQTVKKRCFDEKEPIKQYKKQRYVENSTPKNMYQKAKYQQKPEVQLV